MMSKMCEEIRKSIDLAVGKYNAALSRNDAAGMAAAESEAKEAVKNYKSQSELDLISAHRDDDDPVYGILKECFYKILKTQNVTDNGANLGLEVVESEAQINLKRVFTVLMKQNLWIYRAENFTERLVERKAAGIGDNTNIREKFKMSKKAKAEQPLPNPTSNTSLLKMLQHTIDAIIFKDDGTGNNVYKANNKDLKYVMYCFTKPGKQKLGVATQKVNAVVNLIVRAIYRITNDLQYTIEFKEAKEPESRKDKVFEKKTDSEPADVTLPVPTTEDAA